MRFEFAFLPIALLVYYVIIWRLAARWRRRPEAV
jgi:hypothetical protein